MRPLRHNRLLNINTSACTRLAKEARRLVALALAEDIGVLVERGADELGLLPQVGGEETVGVGDGDEGGLEGVLKGLGGTGRGRVSVADTGKLQQTLDGGGGNETGTAGSGNKLWMKS